MRTPGIAAADAAARAGAPPAPPAAQPAATARLAAGSVRIEYLERSAIVVQGAVTQRLYRFSTDLRVQAVEAGDAEVLLKSPFFRQG